MSQSHAQYTKLRWILTIGGLILNVVDIGTDAALVLKYFLEREYIWTGLTVLFVLAGQLVTQSFSYAWYCDDMRDVLINPEGRRTIAGMSSWRLTVLHLFGMGIFTR